ncbi:MAG: acyltransferase [Intestinibacillus sp.]
MLSTSARRQYLDVLRVLSMLAVVYLHTAAPSLRQFEHMALWHVSNALTSICTIAVPIFFMISGALLLSSDKTADPHYLLRHRLPRVLIPFLLWSALAVVFAYRESGPETAKNMLKSFAGAPVITPYWFIYAIIPIYLLSPLLKKLTGSLSPTLWRYALVLWFLFSSVIKTVRELLPARYAPLLSGNPVYNLTMVGGFLGYFLLGYALSTLRRPVGKRTLWMVVIADLAVIILGTWRRSVGAQTYSEQFKSYLSAYVVILSAAVFLLAREYWEGRPSRGRSLTLLSGASFCVYLAHPRIITLLHIHVMSQHFTAVWQQAVFYGLTLLFSLFITFVFASVRPLCWPFTGQSYRGAANLQALFRHGDGSPAASRHEKAPPL